MSVLGNLKISPPLESTKDMEIDFRAPFTADNTSCNGYLIAATIALKFTSTIHLILGRIRSTNSILMKLLRRLKHGQCMRLVICVFDYFSSVCRIFTSTVPLHACIHLAWQNVFALHSHPSQLTSSFISQLCISFICLPLSIVTFRISMQLSIHGHLQ